MRKLCIIPARFGSIRFPGKPLADINGLPMILQVYQSVHDAEVFDEIVVATDDKRILEVVLEADGKAVMTNPDHPSGTDRCLEALEICTTKSEQPYDVVCNVQGDEPFIAAQSLRSLLSVFDDSENTEIATLVKLLKSEADLMDSNKVKAYFDDEMKALAFQRKIDNNAHEHHKHIGVYAFRSSLLPTLCGLPQSAGEIAERLEQLRWLENGYSIRCVITEDESPSIDSPADLITLQKWLERREKGK